MLLYSSPWWMSFIWKLYFEADRPPKYNFQMNLSKPMTVPKFLTRCSFFRFLTIFKLFVISSFTLVGFSANQIRIRVISSKSYPVCLFFDSLLVFFKVYFLNAHYIDFLNIELAIYNNFSISVILRCIYGLV